MIVLAVKVSAALKIYYAINVSDRRNLLGAWGTCLLISSKGRESRRGPKMTRDHRTCWCKFWTYVTPGLYPFECWTGVTSASLVALKRNAPGNPQERGAPQEALKEAIGENRNQREHPE
ncbi:hypothetical protein L484_009470 [Morus notabilis]|uniref:Uncharacterized protein n=1 Tax=Morus notabilis TaxID=981085 RepID=W9RWQ5_9ROSA|nr:hypothetical protein L484_009470 [Morus notabilis]